MLSDLKLALRTLARTPGFTAIAIATLALGIGMNTAMFSLLNGFLLRPLAYPQSERLFKLDRNSPQQPRDDHSPLNLADITAASSNLADLAAYRFSAFTVTDTSQPPDVPNALRISANFFNVLGARPVLGRTFRPDEAVPGKNNVILLSHRYWQSRFKGAPDIVGRTVQLDGTPVEIVGVMAPDEDMPRILNNVGIFRPLALAPNEVVRTGTDLGVIGRYRAGVTPEQAAAQFAAIGSRLVADHPQDNGGMSLGVRSLQSTTLTGTGLNLTWVLIGLSSFVLLIACANLANLLLTRAMARTREFSIRAALGATRGQLIRPLAAECLVLAAGGSLAALLVSSWTTDWLAARFGNPASPVDLSADVRVLAFMLAATVLTTLLFGIAPAWWAARVKINDSLKSGARGATGTRSQNSFRQLLIVTQFALALVLLAGAGLFLRGMQKMLGTSLGWNPDPVVSGVVNLASPTRFGSAEPILAFHAQLRDRLLALPGVENASVSFDIPLFNPPARRNYLVEGREPPAVGQEIAAYTNGVSAGFLDTTGMRLVRGRFFDNTDHLTSRPTVVINETMARTLFPQGDAIGHRLALAGGDSVQWAEIVGIVEDVRALNMRPSPVHFQVYKPFAQEAWQYVTIAVRIADPAKGPALLEPIRQAVASLDPDMPVLRLMAVTQRIKDNFGFMDTINQLLIIFATLGLFLASLGIYGVVTRLVAQRTGEIGIRMALGANPRSILRLVLGNGLRMVLLGTLAGTVGAVFFSRAIGRALPVLHSDSPLPIVFGSILLALAALIACWLPARRATKVDPMVALRAE